MYHRPIFKRATILRVTILVSALFFSSLVVAGAQTPTHSLDAADGSPQNVLYVDVDGNVSIGLGTEVAAAKLHIRGAGRVGNLPRLPDSSVTSNSADVLIEHQTNVVGESPGTSSAKLALSVVSYLVPQALSLRPVITGTASIEAVTYEDFSRAFMFRAESQDMPIVFETAGVERARIRPNGYLGLGTSDPQGALHIVTAGLPPVALPSEQNGLLVGTAGASKYKWVQSYGGPLSINPKGNNVGVGTTNPLALLHVVGNELIEGNLDVRLTDSSTQNVYVQRAGSIQSPILRLVEGSPIVQMDDSANGAYIRANLPNNAGSLEFGRTSNVQAANPSYSPYMHITGSGNVGVGTTSPQAKLDVAGRMRTQVLEITGGSDLAEAFDVTDPENVEPGLILAIDPDHPGKLRIADTAYDRAVAGVVSGAGGVRPGLMLQQKNTRLTGQYAVALTGRVYVWADASGDAIFPGDLLTTSSTPGYAMKVADYDRGKGAILGKAMTTLESGRGLVLVLISLQ